MTPNELKYSPIEKLCLALVFSIQNLKHYFQAHVMRLVLRENPIKFVMSKPVLSDRLARWYLQFQQFEIVYVPKKTIKGQALADFLADHPIPDNWELSDELPDEDAMVIEIQPPWKMYFDGATHREGAGPGIVFITSQGEILGSYEVKKPELVSYHKYAQRLTQVVVCQRWVVPPPNDYEEEESKVEHIASVLEVEIEDWRQSLIDYLCYGILPENPQRKTEIRRRAPRFLYYKNTLYRRSFDGVLLRCLGTDESL
ncbi:uncharacterized protein [Nicotiana sylvestris]|uniref:uncharacterized protein n=1 Tax=Nicotiana sylvestris TaxID=4096 RepID=UPI00388CE72C